MRDFPKSLSYCHNILCKLHIYIPIYIQQDATLHSLFYLETALHVSGGTITHYQEHKQLYLQHLVFVTPLLLSAAIVEELELVTYATHSTLKTGFNSDIY
jgi:hypothetical protein